MLDAIELLESVGNDASLRYLDAVDMASYFMAKGSAELSSAMTSPDPRAELSARLGGEGNRKPNHGNGVFMEDMEAELESDLKSFTGA